MKDLEKKSNEALHELLVEKRKELFDFRVALSGGKAGKSSDARSLRRDIARILTILNRNKRVSGKNIPTS